MDDDSGVDDDEDPWSQPPQDVPIEERPRRNPPRDWAAPPPWASTGAARRVRPLGGPPRNETPSYLSSSEEGQGLAGSAADRLARGEDLDADGPSSAHPSQPSSVDASSPADRISPDWSQGCRDAEASESHVEVVPRRPRPADAPRSARPGIRTATVIERPLRLPPVRREPARRPVLGEGPPLRGVSVDQDTRQPPGISGVPTIAILAGGVVLAAVILFFLPGVLGVGRDGGGGWCSVEREPVVVGRGISLASPTPIPQPTPQVYTIKTGDTLSKIARKFNVTLDALLAANKDTIKNPNRIRVGDEIVIPLPETQEVPAEKSASPSA
jgi:hypothetical protein